MPEIAEALHRGGVRCLEITLNSTDALKVIESVSKKMGDRILVGAGTVLNAKEASDAIGAGAKFIISPVMSIETIRKTKDLGAVSIPGAFTPTEIFNAYSNGADIYKGFPRNFRTGFYKRSVGPIALYTFNANRRNKFAKSSSLKKPELSLLVSGNHWLIPSKRSMIPIYRT